MRAVFMELAAFSRNRSRYLDDEAFRLLQEWLMRVPDLGALMQGTGGLRKLRIGDAQRGKGKRGGLRVIYFHWPAGPQFWLFTLYEKGEMDDLTPEQKTILKRASGQDHPAHTCAGGASCSECLRA
jgi:hypothetical protein